MTNEAKLREALERIAAPMPGCAWAATERQEIARAALQPTDAARDGAGEDWVMVPREPTEAMLNGARDWSVKRHGIGIGNDEARGCWSAMLAASPTPAKSPLEAVLPCDVRLPPATTLRAGVSVSTLLQALHLAGRPKHFVDRPPSTLAKSPPEAASAEGGAVTQEDRELCLELGIFHTCGDRMILAGWADDSSEMRAIVRHRLATPPADVQSAVAEAVERCARIAEEREAHAARLQATRVMYAGSWAQLDVERRTAGSIAAAIRRTLSSEVPS